MVRGGCLAHRAVFHFQVGHNNGMQKKMLGLAAMALLSIVPVSAQPLTKQAKIEKILDLTNSQASVNQMLDQMTASMNSQMKTQMPNATPERLAQMQEMQRKMLDLVKSRISWEKMRPEMVRAYSETYTDDEVNGILGFYESPAGQSFLKKSPMLMQKVMAVSQAQMADLMPEIQRIVKESAPPAKQ
jgi:hypothetical protein